MSTAQRLSEIEAQDKKIDLHWSRVGRRAYFCDRYNKKAIFETDNILNIS